MQKESEQLQKLVDASGRLFLLAFPFLAAWVIVLTIEIVCKYADLRTLKPGLLTAAIPYLVFATVSAVFASWVIAKVLGELWIWISRSKPAERMRGMRNRLLDRYRN